MEQLKSPILAARTTHPDTVRLHELGSVAIRQSASVPKPERDVILPPLVRKTYPAARAGGIRPCDSTSFAIGG
jgi:hypothetical protein